MNKWYMNGYTTISHIWAHQSIPMLDIGIIDCLSSRPSTMICQLKECILAAQLFHVKAVQYEHLAGCSTTWHKIIKLSDIALRRVTVEVENLQPRYTLIVIQTTICEAVEKWIKTNTAGYYVNAF